MKLNQLMIIMALIALFGALLLLMFGSGSASAVLKLQDNNPYQRISFAGPGNWEFHLPQNSTNASNGHEFEAPVQNGSGNNTNGTKPAFIYLPSSGESDGHRHHSSSFSPPAQDPPANPQVNETSGNGTLGDDENIIIPPSDTNVTQNGTEGQGGDNQSNDDPPRQQEVPEFGTLAALAVLVGAAVVINGKRA